MPIVEGPFQKILSIAVGLVTAVRSTLSGDDFVVEKSERREPPDFSAISSQNYSEAELSRQVRTVGGVGCVVTSDGFTVYVGSRSDIYEIVSLDRDNNIVDNYELEDVQMEMLGSCDLDGKTILVSKDFGRSAIIVFINSSGFISTTEVEMTNQEFQILEDEKCLEGFGDTLFNTGTSVASLGGFYPLQGVGFISFHRILLNEEDENDDLVRTYNGFGAKKWDFNGNEINVAKFNFCELDGFGVSLETFSRAGNAIISTSAGPILFNGSSMSIAENHFLVSELIDNNIQSGLRKALIGDIYCGDFANEVYVCAEDLGSFPSPSSRLYAIRVNIVTGSIEEMHRTDIVGDGGGTTSLLISQHPGAAPVFCCNKQSSARSTGSGWIIYSKNANNSEDYVSLSDGSIVFLGAL